MTEGEACARIGAFTAIALALTACDTLPEIGFLKPKDERAASEESAPRTANIREGDVQAPDIFQVSEPGLWDGRPSLGGTWVAHPDVDTPERVLIRNLGNGKTVTGALFRTERDRAGPRLQVSSDAADALEMLAGAPADLSVTALRKREPEPEEPAATDAPASATTDLE